MLQETRSQNSHAWAPLRGGGGGGKRVYENVCVIYCCREEATRLMGGQSVLMTVPDIMAAQRFITIQTLSVVVFILIPK
jgi:hypothetical protein